MAEWYDYQESAAEFIRDLGFEARTNETVDGVRTSHDVDVLATYQHAGLDLTWVIECKHWSKRVSKLHVLALRAIVEDIGADKGILLSEAGFQSGAIEATKKSNVQATSLKSMRTDASQTLIQRRLLALPERIARSHARYWNMPKYIREDHGLRPIGPTLGYSANRVLDACSALVHSALAGQFPPRGNYTLILDVYTKSEAVDVAEFLIQDVEDRLAAAEASFQPADWEAIKQREKAGSAPSASSRRGRLLTGQLAGLLELPIDGFIVPNECPGVAPLERFKSAYVELRRGIPSKPHA